MKNRITSAGTDAQQSDAAEVPTSSQPCSNTFVIGSQSPPKVTIEGLEIFKGCLVNEQMNNLKKKAIVQVLQQIGLCHAFEFLSHDTVP